MAAPPDLFNLLAASSGIGFPAVRGADNEEAGIGKLRISEMFSSIPEMSRFPRTSVCMLRRPKLRFWPKGGNPFWKLVAAGTVKV